MVLGVFFVVAILVLLLLVPPIYRQRRRASTQARRPLPAVPARLLAGAERTWVVFTTPEMPSRPVDAPMPERAAPMASISSMNPMAPPSSRAALRSALK